MTRRLTDGQGTYVRVEHKAGGEPQARDGNQESHGNHSSVAAHVEPKHVEASVNTDRFPDGEMATKKPHSLHIWQEGVLTSCTGTSTVLRATESPRMVPKWASPSLWMRLVMGRGRQ
eukprot:1065048-Prorocentrum_minimum.AAC.4